MIIELAPYRRITKPYIEKLLSGATDEERVAKLGHVAVATHLHIVAVGHFIGEIFGYTPALNEAIDYCCKYYGITKVTE